MKGHKKNKKGNVEMRLNVQSLHIQVSVYCPASLTIEIQVNMRWKRPASVAVCPESSLCFSSAIVPDTSRAEGPSGCVGGGVLGLLFIQPWPKLGLYNLSKNNRERGGGTGSVHMSSVQSEEKVAHLLYGNSVRVCLGVYFQQFEEGLSTGHLRTRPSEGRRGSRRPT